MKDEIIIGVIFSGKNLSVVCPATATSDVIRWAKALDLTLPEFWEKLKESVEELREIVDKECKKMKGK